MLYDDNINWSGQRRARELKARVKILKQRKKAGKSVPMSAAAQKSLRQRVLLSRPRLKSHPEKAAPSPGGLLTTSKERPRASGVSSTSTQSAATSSIHSTNDIN